MPLLPGESRESDKYQSGLSFLDEYAASVRRWADRTQHELDSAWQDYSRRVQHGIDDLRSAPRLDERVQVNARITTHGYFAPVPINWNDPTFLPNALFGIYSILPYVRAHGDPLKRCPASIALIAGSAVVFLNPQPVQQWCLSPYYVIEQGQFLRLFTSTFIHQDINHFLNNMFSLLRSGYLLERREGSQNFLATTLLVGAASNLVCVLSSFLRARFFGAGREAYFLPTVTGFSAASAALQVIADDAVGAHPLQCWLYLAANSALLQGEKLEAYLCGFITGLVWVWGPRVGPQIEQWLQGAGRNRAQSGRRGGGYRLGSRSEASLRVGPVNAHPLLVHGMLAVAVAVASAAFRAAQSGRRVI